MNSNDIITLECLLKKGNEYFPSDASKEGLECVDLLVEVSRIIDRIEDNLYFSEEVDAAAE